MFGPRVKVGILGLSGVLAAAALFSVSSSSSREDEETERLRQEVRQAFSGDLGPSPAPESVAPPPPEAAPGDDLLKKKLSQVQMEVEKRAKSGVPPIGIILLVKKFQSAMEEGNRAQAEASLNLALKALERPSGEDPLEKKLLRVQNGIKALESKGGDPRLIAQAMSRLEPAVQGGDERRVEETLDAALELLKAAGAASSPAP